MCPDRAQAWTVKWISLLPADGRPGQATSPYTWAGLGSRLPVPVQPSKKMKKFYRSGPSPYTSDTNDNGGWDKWTMPRGSGAKGAQEREGEKEKGRRRKRKEKERKTKKRKERKGKKNKEKKRKERKERFFLQNTRTSPQPIYPVSLILVDGKFDSTEDPISK